MTLTLKSTLKKDTIQKTSQREGVRRIDDLIELINDY